MLPLEHSAILLTCIKQYSVLKPIFGLFESGRITQVLLFIQIASRDNEVFLYDCTFAFV